MTTHTPASPIPQGTDDVIFTVDEATTGLPWNITTNGFRDFLHRQLAKQGHGTYDAEHKAFLPPSDPAEFGAMVDALDALLESFFGDDEPESTP